MVRHQLNPHVNLISRLAPVQRFTSPLLAFPFKIGRFCQVLILEVENQIARFFGRKTFNIKVSSTNIGVMAAASFKCLFDRFNVPIMYLYDCVIMRAGQPGC